MAKRKKVKQAVDTTPPTDQTDPSTTATEDDSDAVAMEMDRLHRVIVEAQYSGDEEAITAAEDAYATYADANAIKHGIVEQVLDDETDVETITRKTGELLSRLFGKDAPLAVTEDEARTLLDKWATEQESLGHVDTAKAVRAALQDPDQFSDVIAQLTEELKK